MYLTTILQWWHRGEWREIGWRASTPRDTDRLAKHAGALAASGGHYRLIHPSIYLDGPPEVVWQSEAGAA